MLNRHSRNEAADIVQDVVQKAGFKHCTPIQLNIVPSVFQGRDLFVETLGARGKTLATLIIALFRVEYTKKTTQALIITADPAEVLKTERQFDLLPAEIKGDVRLAPLGYEKNPKKELKHFNSPPHLIIGTTERIIDHLRRDNIDLQNIELLIVLDNTVEEYDGFFQDILFITSKTANLQQRIVFSSVSTHSESLIEQLHRPHILNYDDWSDSKVEHLLYSCTDGKEKINALKTLIDGKTRGKTVLITKNPAQAASLEKRLSSEDLTSDDLAVSTFKHIEQTRTLAYSTVIFFQFPADYHFYVRALRKVTANGEKTAFISLIQEKERKSLDKLKEEYKMEIKEENLPQEHDAELRSYIEKTLKAIKEEETPELLDYYKKVIKKHVPLFLRHYFTAYLLKQMSAGASPSGSAELTTMFVSVGKNRKVFPKDLSKLFSSALHIDPSVIGQIKILDSYSFIDIPSHRAQAAIDELNDQEYRGRKLTVNYARKKN